MNFILLGRGAGSRIDQTTNIAYPVIIRKDNGEASGDAWRVFSGGESVICSKEVSLQATGDQTITLPAGCKIYLSEVGVIVERQSGTVTRQPTVRFGYTGAPTGVLSPTSGTALTSVGMRERYESLATNSGLSSLVAGVSTTGIASSGASYMGRFYWKGLVLETY